MTDIVAARRRSAGTHDEEIAEDARSIPIGQLRMTECRGMTRSSGRSCSLRGDRSLRVTSSPIDSDQRKIRIFRTRILSTIGRRRY